MADFIGMYEAFGFYKAEWYLRFAYGLERWSNTEEFTALSVRERVKCMCHVGLSGMAKKVLSFLPGTAS